MANGGQVIINRREFLKLGLGIGGAVVGYKLFQKDVDKFLYNLINDEPQTRAPTPVVNETVKPTATPEPKYDYYDEEFKVGFYIEDLDKQNITNLFKTFKEVTPDDYADVIKYAPKKIVKSPDKFSSYGLGSDEIELETSIERLGGSDDLKIRLMGVPTIYAEMGNAKQFKTGVKFNSVYESELEVNLRKANYAVKVGAWTQEQADNYMKNISEQLKSGTYFEGTRFNQS